MIIFCSKSGKKPRRKSDVYVKRVKKKEVVWRPLNLPERDLSWDKSRQIKSLDLSTAPNTVVPAVIRYEDPEMQRREVAAKVQSDRLKKTLAPSFNKGPMQPIMTAEQAKWIGRK